MKAISVATALLCSLALTATPQTAPDVTGDWWWLDMAEGPGPLDELLLVDGEARRDGDRSEMTTYTVYSDPDENNIVAMRMIQRFDCASKTSTAILDREYFTNGRSVPRALDGGEQQVAADDVWYRFACTSDRRKITHFGRRSLRAVTAEIFSTPR